jgi:hypothetical protein
MWLARSAYAVWKEPKRKNGTTITIKKKVSTKNNLVSNNKVRGNRVRAKARVSSSTAATTDHPGETITEEIILLKRIIRNSLKVDRLTR